MEHKYLNYTLCQKKLRIVYHSILEMLQIKYNEENIWSSKIKHHKIKFLIKNKNKK